MGELFRKSPYMNQRSTPPQNRANIPVEMSFVDLVFHTLSSCGKSEIVVNNAATNPTAVMASIGAFLALVEYLVFDY